MAVIISSANYAAAGGGAYAGPGDVLSGAIGYWGMRAYNAAYIGGNAIQLVDGSGLSFTNITTVAGGGLDETAIQTFLTNHGGTGYVDILYDQIGTKHLIQGAVSKMPTIQQSGIGSRSTLKFVAASNQLLLCSATNYVEAQPFTFSVVCNRTSAIATNGCVAVVSSSGGDAIYYRAAAGALFIDAGLVNTVTAGVSDAAWLSVQALFNATSSTSTVNGTSSGTTSTGTQALVSTNSATIGNDGTGGGYFEGQIAEFGIWPGNNSGSFAGLTTNQKTSFWGF